MHAEEKSKDTEAHNHVERFFRGSGGSRKRPIGVHAPGRPDVKILNATKNESSNLKKQETELYAQIGEIAIENGGREQ